MENKIEVFQNEQFGAVRITLIDVGYPHSKIMTEMGLSLEEYTEFIKSYRDDCRFIYRQSLGARVEIYYVPANEEIIFISMPDNCVYQTSGNNIDGFIITVWRKNDD